MAERRRKKYRLDLDEEDFEITFTDKDGVKRRCRVITSEGMVEYRDARGRRLLRLMREPVEGEE